MSKIVMLDIRLLHRFDLEILRDENGYYTLRGGKYRFLPNFDVTRSGANSFQNRITKLLELSEYYGVITGILPRRTVMNLQRANCKVFLIRKSFETFAIEHLTHKYPKYNVLHDILIEKQELSESELMELANMGVTVIDIPVNRELSEQLSEITHASAA